MKSCLNGSSQVNWNVFIQSGLKLGNEEDKPVLSLYVENATYMHAPPEQVYQAEREREGESKCKTTKSLA